LTTGLRVVWYGNVVFGFDIPEKALKGLINEMRPSVAYNHPWSSKTREYDLVEHLAGVLGVGDSARICLHPLGDVIHSDEDVLAIMGLLEWPHEVNTPYVEQFNLKVVCEWHCIASGDASLQLAPLSPLDKFSGVFIHCWLEETTLPDLCLSLECSKVASVCCGVAFLYDLYPFCCWYTSPIQVWVIPKVISTLENELLLVSPRWYVS
jgi:hypothetical protein